MTTVEGHNMIPTKTTGSGQTRTDQDHEVQKKCSAMLAEVDGIYLDEGIFARACRTSAVWFEGFPCTPPRNPDEAIRSVRIEQRLALTHAYIEEFRRSFPV